MISDFKLKCTHVLTHTAKMNYKTERNSPCVGTGVGCWWPRSRIKKRCKAAIRNAVNIFYLIENLSYLYLIYIILVTQNISLNFILFITLLET